VVLEFCVNRFRRVRCTGEKHTERPPLSVASYERKLPLRMSKAGGTLSCSLSKRSGSLATVFGYALSVPITFDLLVTEPSVCHPVTDSLVFGMAITPRQ
jgi:hypothetical protein